MGAINGILMGVYAVVIVVSLGDIYLNPYLTNKKVS